MKLLFLLTIFLMAVSAKKTEYDPSTTSGEVTTIDAEFEYGKDDRKVPLRVYLPALKSEAPVVLFSHGLGGSKANNTYLGNRWAGRGYVVVFMQHAGSDESVWKDGAIRDRLKNMKEAVNHKNFLARVGDVTATLDQLTKWNKKGQKLAGRLNLEKIGMSGHSFGAITTQALSGQSYGRKNQLYTDARINAAIAMSPSVPRIGNDKKTFGKVEIPWLLMTGTNDKSVIARFTVEDRLKVFQQLPKSDHFYELVLNEADHMSFSDRTLTGKPHRNPKHHQSILDISSAFWDAYLKEDKAAKKWIDGEKANKVLEPKDKWQRK